MTIEGVLREMRCAADELENYAHYFAAGRLREWVGVIEAGIAEKDAGIERLRNALAHYATDERADGWVAIAALAGKEETKT